MKILTIEHEVEGVAASAFKSHLDTEAHRVWDLYQKGIIREAYFRADRTEAILILECVDAADAKAHLDQLTLAQAGLITFEIIPLKPYPGFSRFFTILEGETSPSMTNKPQDNLNHRLLETA